jgi:hypothetical protein
MYGKLAQQVGFITDLSQWQMKVNHGMYQVPQITVQKPENKNVSNYK